MPKYYDIRKYNNGFIDRKSNNGEYASYPFKSQNDEFDNGRGSLIIEDNTIYEIDDECIERARKNRINQRYDRTNTND